MLSIKDNSFKLLHRTEIALHKLHASKMIILHIAGEYIANAVMHVVYKPRKNAINAVRT